MIGPSAIAISGDTAAGQWYVPRARHMLARLQARVDSASITPPPLLRAFERFDDMAYGYAIHHNGQYRAVIVVDEAGEERADELRERPAIPDFYSGAVIGGTISNGRMSSFLPTEKCAEVHGLPSSLSPTRKLAVSAHAPFAEIIGGGEYSQYINLKPTMYSGKMRWVVQLLMGFGRQHIESIYDKAGASTPVEQRRAQVMTQYEQEVADRGLQIRYDWRVFRTHGIYTAGDGTLWLIEIGRINGVLAMPLPMNAPSMRPEFADRVEADQDTPAAYAIQQLGGFPTGESFPAAHLETAIRAGSVLRLVSAQDMALFYDRSPYSSAMGWAFNESGNEAHNTCWDVADDNVQIGFHFAVGIDIGGIAQPSPPAKSATIKSRISKFADTKEYRGAFRVLVDKIDRLTNNQADEILSLASSDREVIERLDATVVQPIANGSARLRLESSGRLYHPGEIQPHIKFPEPDLGYLVSHDMDPKDIPAWEPEECNTVMHVYFERNTLNFVRFFRPAPYSLPDRTDSNEDNCMYIGEFTRTEYSGGGAVPAMMFTSQFDDRDEVFGKESIRKTTGRLFGYTTCACADNPTNLTLSYCFRIRTFSKRLETTQRNGIILRSAVTVPFHDRCAYFYTLARGEESLLYQSVWDYVNLADPWGCPAWRNFPGYSGSMPSWCGSPLAPNPELFPGCWTLGLHPDGCGPVTNRTAMQVSPSYFGGECSDFADSGPWCFLCDNMDAKRFSITPPALPGYVSTQSENKAKVVTHLANCSEQSPILVSSDHLSAAPVSSGNYAEYERPWFVPSPDPFSFATQYVEASINSFGKSDAQRYMKKPNSGEFVLIGGPVHPAMLESSTTWVGVV